MARRRFLRQEAGAVLLLVLAFIGLAVPLTIGAIQVAGELNVLSRVYDKLLRSRYAASAGAELAFWTVINDPSFDDGLTPLDPCTEFVIEVGGAPVTVRVCRWFTTVSVQGQGIIITKSVNPTTAQAGQSTTFTYTLTLDNQGTGTVTLNRIYDYLPPYFTYVSGSTSGLTTLNPAANQSNTTLCGSKPYSLNWDVHSANLTIEPGQQRTLTFQATANLPNGTYYNQGLARYVPWWSTDTVDVYSPYTAPVVAGTGSPYCGYELNVLVTKSVEPAIGNPGVEQEFTYTITTKNMSSTTRYVCKIDDNLPPTFVYVAGSSGEYPSNMDIMEPDLTWDAVSERWTAEWARWVNGQGSDLDPLATLAPGAVSTQVFRARATPLVGVNYFNEANAMWSSQLVGGHCKQGTGDSGTTNSGGGQSAEVQGTAIYDIVATSSDGAIQARIQYYSASGQIQILSWQEY
ncbi:MAG: hypothetical protein Q7K03_06100 [Dehalococcoidia bacterium]|nr:hypothetical protein [Dehalococcoidia bacterium]